jgi:hypothetical protein
LPARVRRQRADQFDAVVGTGGQDVVHADVAGVDQVLVGQQELSDAMAELRAREKDAKLCVQEALRHLAELKKETARLALTDQRAAEALALLDRDPVPVGDLEVITLSIAASPSSPARQRRFPLDWSSRRVRRALGQGAGPQLQVIPRPYAASWPCA